MRVAIAGAGAFAKYFVEELPKAGHDIVLLTRTHKAFFDGMPGLVEQRITDYASVDHLAQLLHDCDAVISTIYDLTQAFADIHLALIAACKKTPKCKRFIPSEYGGNSEAFPESPESVYCHNMVVKDALRAQHELEWTVLSIGWLADYVVPAANRYHNDIGPLHAFDWNTKTMTIPGTGHEKFAVTCARDVAKAVALVLKSKATWRPFTYVQGEETTWLEIAETMRSTGGLGDALTVTHESIESLEAVIQANESYEAKLTAEFKLYVPLGHIRFDQEKVQRDRDQFFSTMKPRTVKELVEAVTKDATVIV